MNFVWKMVKTQLGDNPNWRPYGASGETTEIPLFVPSQEMPYRCNDD